jgi:NhaP-type Na+/H+ or K+/H+ antiporter
MIQSGIAGFVVLLMAAAAVAVLVRRLPIPYVTALALVGLLAGVLVGSHGLQLMPSLILFGLLPGLLFEAAYNLDWKHLRDNLLAVGALATVGVLLTTAVAAALGHFALGLPVTFAILFGAMVAPTDPVAVIAVFGRLGVPSRLARSSRRRYLAREDEASRLQRLQGICWPHRRLGNSGSDSRITEDRATYAGVAGAPTVLMCNLDG